MLLETKATFKLQALTLNSDFFWNLIFFCVVVHILMTFCYILKPDFITLLRRSKSIGSKRSHQRSPPDPTNLQCFMVCLYWGREGGTPHNSISFAPSLQNSLSTSRACGGMTSVGCSVCLRMENKHREGNAKRQSWHSS